MKNFGSKTDFCQQRIREIMAEYEKRVMAKEIMSFADMMPAIANSPCSRFWVSPERVMAVNYEIRQEKNPLEKMRPTKSEMFKEIFRRVEKKLNDNPDMDYLQAVTDVIDEPAPRFYLSPSSIRKIIITNRKQWKKIKNNYEP